LTVKRLSLPGLPTHGDVSDFLAAHPSADLLRLVDQTPLFKSVAATAARANKRTARDVDRPDSTATAMLKQFDDLIGKGEAELFHTPKGDAYVSLLNEGRRETYGLKSSAFRQRLACRYYRDEGKASPGEALRSAIETLIGRAVHEGPERTIRVRTAEFDGKVYLDLGNADWRCVEVSKDGWRIVSDPPVRFRRPPNLRGLPEPTHGGDLSPLFEFLNVPDSRHRILLATWIVAALYPRGPYPILVLHGGQGSAKSTLAAFVKKLIDPAEPLLRSAPRDERDLVIAVNNSQVVTLDNLSSLHGWLSDALCRVATGGGIATRELYTNDEEAIFDVQCPIILNGIEELASRADLLDRCIILAMPPIPPSQRRDEARLKAEFERSRPALLGALLTALSTALANRDIEVQALPRMADFARLALAAEPALGFPPGSFLAAYDANIAEANDSALESSSVAIALFEFLKPGDTWEGSAKELLEALAKRVSEEVRREKHWPKSARGLTNALARVASNLATADVTIEKFKQGHERKRVLSLRRGCVPQSAPSAAVTAGQVQGEPADGAADEWFPKPPGAAEAGSDEIGDFSTTADDADDEDGFSGV